MRPVVRPPRYACAPCNWWVAQPHPELSACGSSYSIRTPSLKFVCLPFPKTWLIFSQSIKRSSDLDLWSFDLKIWSRVTRVMAYLPVNFQLAMPFYFWLGVRHGTDRRTDRETDVGHQRLMPPPYGVGHNKPDGDVLLLIVPRGQRNWQNILPCVLVR